jgi:hypothetical protein
VISPVIVISWAAGTALLRMTGWRRWPVFAAAAVALAGVVWIQGGPVSAVSHHFAGLLALGQQFGRPMVHLPAPGAFLIPQLPLAVPAGLIAASVTPRGDMMGPEFTAAARKRADRSDRRAQAKAKKLAGASVPSSATALAVSIGGDLPDQWRQGRYIILPPRIATLPRLVVGRPGQGKTVYIGREVYLAGLLHQRATVIDCKGEAGFGEEIAAAYQAGWNLAEHEVDAPTVHLWPQTALNGWTGGPRAVANRLLSCWEWDLAAQWYREIVSMALRMAMEAPGPPVASSGDLVARMAPGALMRLWAGHRTEQDYIKAHAAKFDDVSVRVGNLMASLGATLDGTRPLGTADLTVLSLPVMALEHDAAAILRVAMADLAHHVAVRKPPGDRELIVVDEASAVAGGRDHMIHLAERGRSAGVACVMCVQSRRGLGDDDDADRLIGAVGLVALFGTAEPEDILKLAGTVRQVEMAAQVEDGMLTGRGTATVRSSHRIDANAVRALAPGQAFLLAGGRAELAQIIRAPGNNALALPRRPFAVISRVPGRLQSRQGQAATRSAAPSLDPPESGTARGHQLASPSGEASPTDDRDNQEVP